jgi:fused signal recognition particle receptor
MAGFAEKLKHFFKIKSPVGEELFDDLADLLVEGDFGPAEAFDTVDRLKERCRKRKVTDAEEVRNVLAGLLVEDLKEAPLILGEPPDGGRLTVILLLGVNGVGKTTTAAKLAARYRDHYDAKPILAAADTFRAAAVDQIKLHGERLGIRVVAHKQGGDPAAVVYDAVEAALAGGGNLIVADTAGRMHTKTALVEELKKIDRIVESKAGDAAYRKWLVLDATTGRNALVQAETFHGAVPLDGVILSKTDSTARGGVVFSLARTLALPVIYTANGEQYGDLHPFDPESYVREFTGLA